MKRPIRNLTATGRDENESSEDSQFYSEKSDDDKIMNDVDKRLKLTSSPSGSPYDVLKKNILNASDDRKTILPEIDCGKNVPEIDYILTRTLTESTIIIEDENSADYEDEMAQEVFTVVAEGTLIRSRVGTMGKVDILN